MGHFHMLLGCWNWRLLFSRGAYPEIVIHALRKLVRNSIFAFYLDPEPRGLHLGPRRQLQEVRRRSSDGLFVSEHDPQPQALRLRSAHSVFVYVMDQETVQSAIMKSDGC